MLKLMEISKKVYSQDLKQTVQLCILRSDYMIDQPKKSEGLQLDQQLQLKLVEYNTIASSLGCLSQNVGEL